MPLVNQQASSNQLAQGVAAMMQTSLSPIECGKVIHSSPLLRWCTSNSARLRHISFPLLDIAMPVLVLFLGPELLCLALMLNISPLTAHGEDAFNVVDALNI